MRAQIPATLHRLERLVPGRLRRFARQVAPRLIEEVHRSVLAAAPAKPTQTTVADGPLRGRRFTCRLRHEADYIFGTHEPAVAGWLQALLRPGDTVFDVGAHVGYTALIAARIVGRGGRVVAFEPNPGNCRLLEANLAANPDLATCIVLEASAVADNCGSASFGGHDATGRLGAGSLTVATVSLDAYVARTGRRPALIKLDIEGGETRAFDGMLDVLRTDRPSLIVEVHDPIAQRRFAQLVTDFGYHASAADATEPITEQWHGRRLYLAQPLVPARPARDP